MAFFLPRTAGILVLFICVGALLSSPAYSATAEANCTVGDRTFQNCTELATLNATLYWTYHASNDSASIAFQAPSETNDWVAYGVNPNGTGMAGGQAIVAYADKDGKFAARPYRLDSYSSVKQVEWSDLSVKFTDVSAEQSKTANVTTIFANFKLPNGTLNYIWNVGLVANGQVQRHDMKPANLNSKATTEIAPASSTSASESSAARDAGVTTTSAVFSLLSLSLVGTLFLV